MIRLLADTFDFFRKDKIYLLLLTLILLFYGVMIVAAKGIKMNLPAVDAETAQSEAALYDTGKLSELIQKGMRERPALFRANGFMGSKSRRAGSKSLTPPPWRCFNASTRFKKPPQDRGRSSE